MNKAAQVSAFFSLEAKTFFSLSLEVQKVYFSAFIISLYTFTCLCLCKEKKLNAVSETKALAYVKEDNLRLWLGLRGVSR